MPSPPRALGGFTLVELLITVTIVAILAGIAVPLYTAQIARANRAEARTALLQAAQYMQRFYSANDRFDKDRNDKKVAEVMPAALKRAPADGTALYELTVDAAASTYTLTMAPKTGTRMAGDKCGKYVINHLAVRSNLSADDKTIDTTVRDSCWK